ncbi:MAG: hypothetical protein U0X20_13940 [Caldilineaceae bacterium]
MNDNQNFAVEQLEDRLETFCIYIPYVGTCYVHLLFLRIPYPCIKIGRICF